MFPIIPVYMKTQTSITFTTEHETDELLSMQKRNQVRHARQHMQTEHDITFLHAVLVINCNINKISLAIMQYQVFPEYSHIFPVARVT